MHTCLVSAMAPKIQYDAAEMQDKANEAAEREIVSVTKEGVVLPRSAEVACEHLGVLKDDEFEFTLEAKPTMRSTVGYKWSYRDNAIKKARYDYSVEHNTSLPEQSKTAFKCSRLPDIARESAAVFEEQSGLRDVTCRVVGVPRPINVHLDGRIELSSILKLAMWIAPVEYALCAQVHNHSWLCHRGSFQGGALSTTPFDEADLVLKDLGVDLWVEGMERPRKRVRTHLRLGVLAEEIRKHAEAFHHLVARAHWKAEEIRAGDGQMDEGAALLRYESNPFKWICDSKAEIIFIWTIPSSDGIRREFTTTRVNDLLSGTGRRVTFPYIPRAESNQSMWAQF